MRVPFCKFVLVTVLIGMTFGFALPAECAPTEHTSILRRSVVRIYTVSQTPDFQTPWDPGSSEEGWGSGFIISGRRILTNAHVVSNARFISVEKEGDSRRYEARVKYIAHDCDLAMLEVVNVNFFDQYRAFEGGRRAGPGFHGDGSGLSDRRGSAFGHPRRGFAS